ncbi:MAG: tryptophan-rich sensory protein [Candidatus Promineofilum sp.]|nr:tryptophan-rich sensory protein [Promineifilum sp.]
MSNKNRSILTLIVMVIGIIVANYLGFRANSDTGDIANTAFNDANYFFPATYVFTTIWPVIYTGLLGWAIYQALPANRDNPRFRAAAPWLMVNIFLNGLWVLVFGMEAFVSTVPIMLVLVFTTLVAYRKLEIGRARVGMWERILQIPVSIYLGWLTVATVANVAAALIAAGWNGFGISNEVWGMVMLLVGAGLAVFLYRGLHNDVVIPLVYLYAYIGIIVRYSDVTLVLAGAVIGAAIVAATAGRHFISRRGQGASLKTA